MKVDEDNTNGWWEQNKKSMEIYLKYMIKICLLTYMAKK